MPDSSPAFFDPFVAALPEAALVVDLAGTVVAANQPATATLAAGLSTSLAGQQLNLFVRSTAVAKAISASFETGAHHEIEYDELSRIPRTISAHTARLQDGNGEPHVLVLFRDRTREAQVEKMRSDFVANASHELRTPLTTLSGFIETMQGAARQDEKAQDAFLKLMKAQADRMSMLIDDLLSLSRIELDEHVEPTDRVDLALVARQAESLLRPVAVETGCELHVTCEPDAFVKGDAHQLGQVAHNLIENAIKYSGKGKRVTARVYRHGGDVMFSVADNGPGIAPHHIPRLTERFYRVNVQDSRARGGTGLGLAICKHIVNRHRGRLAIASEPGAGSTFTISLPSF